MNQAARYSVQIKIVETYFAMKSILQLNTLRTGIRYICTSISV